jgi:putative transcriptional regulator
MKNTVRNVREEKGINQSELARLVGVSRQSIHAIETGTFNPSVLLALKIALALNTKVTELFILERKDQENE